MDESNAHHLPTSTPLRSGRVGYALAVAAVAAATLVRVALDPALGDSYPLATYLGAVAVVAWYGRTGPAVVTLALSGFLSLYLFFPPRYSLALTEPGVVVGLALFLAVGGGMAAMGHALRAARSRTERLLAEAVVRQGELARAAAVEAEQRERLRVTLASIGDGVISTDAAGNVTYLNAVAEALTGWTNGEAAGVPLTRVFRIVNADTRRPVENPAVRALTEGVIVGLANHTVLIAKDGTERPIDDNAAPIRSASGAVVGCVLVFRDITERDRAEEALRHSEERFRATFEQAAVGIAHVGPDGRWLRVNGRLCEMLGFSREELSARTFQDITHPDDLAADLAEVRRLLAGEVATYSMEKRYVRKDGSPVWANLTVSLVRTGDGRPAYFISVVEDVSARKRAEAAQRDAQEQFATTLESITDGFVRYDREWRIVYVNAEAERLNQLARADLLGKTVWVLFPAVVGTTLEAEFRRAVAEQVTVEFENYYEPFGRWYALKGYPTPDGGLTTYIRDITEQKTHREALAASEARYRAIGESIDFGVWVCDADGRNTYASDSFLRLVGMTQEQCSDFGWGDALHPDDAAATVAAWKECVRTHGTWDREHRFRGADGRWYHVLARGVPLRGAAGDVLGWAGINLDVTRLVRTEREVVRLAAESDRQRRLYETVLTNTPDFVYVFSLDHRVLYANDALISTWGCGHDGAIGKTFLEIGYEPWHAATHDREIDQVRATRRPIRGEVSVDGPSGRRSYEYIFVPVLGADGEVEAVAGTTRDVTERRAAEERVRASEERQAYLVTLTDTVRPHSHPVDVQSAASRVLGEYLGANRVVYFEIRGDEYVVERDYTAGVRPLAGRYPVAAFGPAVLTALLDGRTVVEADATAEPDRPAAERAAFAAIQVRGHVDVPLVKGGRFVAGMTVHVSDRRDWTLQEVALIEDTAERTWAAVERARAEAALRASEERFRTLFESMDEGFCVIEMEFDPAGRATDYRIEVMNPAFETHTGMRGLAGRSIRQAIPGLEEFWYETYGRVASTGVPARFVHRAGPMGGRWFDVSAFRLGGDGSAKVAVLFNDITGRKQAEADRERLVDQLRDQDRRKDEFLATLAHELRNPLAPIRNGLQVIRLAGVTGAVEQTRRMMERQLGQMVRLVDDLLDVSRVTRGLLELRTERVDLRAVIDAAVETARPVIEAAAHEFVVAVPDEPVYADGDVTRLAQVVANLLTNSCKYTPRGGRVRVSLRRDGDTAVVAVADTGVGIPPAMLDKVFELFVQVDRSLEKTTGGLGIGLSLVKGLVEMHGGTVEARSEGVGRGSEFVVRLPAAPAPAGAADDAIGRGADVAPAAGRRILVVDDNVDSADSLGQLLELLGNDVRTAYDGEEGAAAAAAFRPDVVLMDLGMPKVNGYEACRRIREQPWGQDMVLVALTGWGQEHDRQRSSEAGFDHHLVKPVDPATLMKLLNGCPSA